MTNRMTAGEAAERIYRLLANGKCMDGLVSIKGDYFEDALELAASILRRVASGKLAEVIHAHWNYTSRPNEDCMGGSHGVIECSHCKEDYGAEYDHCPSCGALMDGKDDSHE